MPLPISPIGVTPALPEVRSPAGLDKTSAGDDFRNLLTDAIDKVEQYRRQAETSVEQFLTGEREDIHNVAIETQKAELAFELFLQTRNKVVQAYHEVMRMQV